MRISFVIDTLNGGGKERRCLQIIQGLNKAGYNDIQLIIVNNGIAYPEIYKTTAQIVIIDRKARRISNRQTIRELEKHFVQFKPNIIQVWNRMSASFVNLIKIRLILHLRFKYIVAFVADCDPPLFCKRAYFINRLSLFLANKVVGNSKAGLRAYSVPKNKQVCIYNGFNQDRLSNIHLLDTQAKKHELGIITPFVVSMIARVGMEKDYQAFIDCANKLLERRNDITFLAVGSGKKIDEYKRRIPNYNKDKILFLGFRSDVEEIIKVSTLTVLFTNYHLHGEGISNSILESMAIGVPVVATQGGGTPEIIEHGKNGYMVNNNDISQSVHYIDMIISNSILHQDMSQHCVETVREFFDLEKTTNQYINLYKSLLTDN